MNTAPIDKERIMPHLDPSAVRASWKVAPRRLDHWTRRP
jgi:hypothetical protein